VANDTVLEQEQTDYRAAAPGIAVGIGTDRDTQNICLPARNIIAPVSVE